MKMFFLAQKELFTDEPVCVFIILFVLNSQKIQL